MFFLSFFNHFLVQFIIFEVMQFILWIVLIIRDATWIGMLKEKSHKFSSVFSSSDLVISTLQMYLYDFLLRCIFSKHFHSLWLWVWQAKRNMSFVLHCQLLTYLFSVLCMCNRPCLIKCTSWVSGRDIFGFCSVIVLNFVSYRRFQCFDFYWNVGWRERGGGHNIILFFELMLYFLLPKTGYQTTNCIEK